MRIKLFTKHEYVKSFFSQHTLVAEDAPSDLIVSYDWPKIICLDAVRGINLHISYLPFNRGSDPNLWSWLEGTPKGITIHWMDARIDTGDIIIQRVFPDSQLKSMTLKESYSFLHTEIEKLFTDNFPQLLTRVPLKQAHEKATSHRAVELTDLKKWLGTKDYQVLPEEMIHYWKKHCLRLT